LIVKLLETEPFVKSENYAPTGNKLRFSSPKPPFVHKLGKKSYLWAEIFGKNGVL